VSLDSKGGRRVSLTNLPLLFTDCLKILTASASWIPKGLSRNRFTFTSYLEEDTEGVERSDLLNYLFFTELTFGNVLQSHNLGSRVSIFMYTSKQTNRTRTTHLKLFNAIFQPVRGGVLTVGA